MQINERDIEATITRFEKTNDISSFANDIDQVWPTLYAYTLADNFNLLTAEEKEYFNYLVSIILITIYKKGIDLADPNEEDINHVEEEVWMIWEENKNPDFKIRLDGFFENYPEEDLLAFVEDSLVPSEEDFISSSGRELMFVGLKTIIDVLLI